MSVQRSSHQDQKTIDFFFAAKPSHRNIKAPSETTLTVPGLSLIPGFIDRDEEQTLLSFLDGQVWRTDLARR